MNMNTEEMAVATEAAAAPAPAPAPAAQVNEYPPTTTHNLLPELLLHHPSWFIIIISIIF